MQKQRPQQSLELVLHPERDMTYVHFENAAQHPFQPNPSGVPRVNAWWLADAALTTYWPPADAHAIFARAGLDSEFLSVESTNCYVAWTDAFVIVAFRGTQPNEWEDILDDAKFRLVPWPTGRVHRGFKEGLDRIWSRLEAKLRELDSTRKVWLCGHSLGAALAVLAADRYGRAQGIATIGCPRVGDVEFAAAFDQKLQGKSLRCVNDQDVVTHVPPPLPLLPYKHVAERRFIDPNGTISSREPRISHFFVDLIGDSMHLLEVMNGLNAGVLRHAPEFVLDHMPKSYAVDIWNDFDTNGA
jgi:triacylglycerol lipase